MGYKGTQVVKSLAKPNLQDEEYVRDTSLRKDGDRGRKRNANEFEKPDAKRVLVRYEGGTNLPQHIAGPQKEEWETNKPDEHVHTLSDVQSKEYSTFSRKLMVQLYLFLCLCVILIDF